MRNLHIIIGVLTVIVFLLTGQYMSFHAPNITELDDGTRMMLRSRHIYILLAGLINLGVGCYFSYRRETWRRVLQTIGSILIGLAPLILIAAFFYEPTLSGLPGILTLPAIAALLLGIFAHLLSGLRTRSS